MKDIIVWQLRFENDENVRKGEHITMKKRNVKIELFFVILKILLCVAVLTASTYALFTSETQNNISVTSGEMDMNLYQITLDGQRFDLARHDEGIFTEGDWEPNQTRIAFLVVENKSNIPVKYTLQLDADIDELEVLLRSAHTEPTHRLTSAEPAGRYCRTDAKSRSSRTVSTLCRVSSTVSCSPVKSTAMRSWYI